jgi:short-subunit dehydrogenase
MHEYKLNMKNLNNKVAIITGSANGLGKALAIELYKQGCHLALIDIDFIGLQKLKAGLQKENQTITIYKTDISKEEEVIAVRQKIMDEHGHIDILINNAAISISQPFDMIDLTDYKRLMDVNFWGTVYCSKYFLDDLKQREDSRLVNIISDFALMGFPGKTTYASSKSAVMGFTNCLKTELKGTGIQVCLVIPPPIDTNIVSSGKHIDEVKRQNEINFLKRNGMPIDKAAQKIVSKIMNGKYRIVIGAMMFWIDVASRLFPTTVHSLIGKNKKRFDFI